MASIRKHVVLNTAADTVWKMVGDPAAIIEWGPGIESCKMDGSKRILTLAQGGTVEEEIVTIDPELLRIQYRVCSGLPLDSHLATVDVIELSADSCMVVYSTDLTPTSFAKHIAAALAGSIRQLGEKYGNHRRIDGQATLIAT